MIHTAHDQNISEAMQELASFPLLAAIYGRRSRRFAMGGAIPDGPLAYESKHDPVPLSDLERLIVLTSMAGSTGWHRLPHDRVLLHRRLGDVLPANPRRRRARGSRGGGGHARAAAAAEAAARVGAAPREAMAQEQRGLVLRERGAGDRGDALLAAALASYRRLGMTRRADGLAARP